MLILLSPAKSLDFETPAPTKKAGVPRFLDEQTTVLARVLKKKKAGDLAELMDLSKGLADLNYQRYQRFDAKLIHQQVGKPNGSKDGTPPAAKQALWAFTGDVYQGIDVLSMKAKQIERAQACIRMLSGLYGVLKPCDEILPYRLEMGTKLKTSKGKNLYEFWGSAITEALAEETPDWICNLASMEYYKSVKEAELPCPVVHPAFKDESKGEYKVMGLFAKYARGLMSRWIVDNNVKKPGELCEFDVHGYCFNKKESTDLRPVFLRPASAR
jgi:hypothetical protein